MLSPRVHAHGVEVLDGADEHAVVRAVAHDLHLELLPAQQRLLDEDFLDRRKVQSSRDDAVELFFIVSDAAALSAERERRPDDERERPMSWAILRASSIVCATPERATSRPILSIASLNFWRSSPFSMASAFAPMSLTPYFVRMPPCQRSIAALRAVWPPRVGRRASGFSAAMIFSMISTVIGSTYVRRGELRVGHDRGRVGVEQNDGVTLLRERLAGLHAGVVELAALSDDDGAAAEEEDFLEVGISRHGARKGKMSFTLSAVRRRTPRLKL